MPPPEEADLLSPKTLVRRASLQDVRRAFDERSTRDQRENFADLIDAHHQRNERPSLGESLRMCWDLERARRYGKQKAQRCGPSRGTGMPVDEARQLTARLYPGYALAKVSPPQATPPAPPPEGEPEEPQREPPFGLESSEAEFSAALPRLRTPSFADPGSMLPSDAPSFAGPGFSSRPRSRTQSPENRVALPPVASSSAGERAASRDAAAGWFRPVEPITIDSKVAEKSEPLSSASTVEWLATDTECIDRRMVFR